MVDTDLTEELIKDGESRLRQLDRSKVDVRSAVWLYNTERGVWRLTLGIRGAAKAGPMQAYRRIQPALKRANPLRLRLGDVSVADAKLGRPSRA